MPNSLFTTLVGMLDKRSLGGIARALGEPEQSISRGTESSIAAILGGLAAKSSDPGALRGILDLVPSTLGDVTGSQMASSVANPNSPLLTVGKRLMSSLFGSSESAVTGSLSTHSGLRPGVTSTLMAMVAPMVISYIGQRVRDERITMSGLGSLLQGETAAVRSALPAGLYDLFWPQEPVKSSVIESPVIESPVLAQSPVIAQSVERERSSTNWLPLLAAVALIPALFWVFNQGRRPTMPIAPTPTAPTPTGEASRIATPAPQMVCSLPANVNMGRDEARLMAFVQDPDAKPGTNTLFMFDRLAFDTGSATLRPQSQAQLNNIATILTNCPTVHLKIAGYTDNVGAVEPNLRLSQNRANSVVAQLVSKGVPPDHLAAAGYGQDDPVADNSSDEGRARNRRVAVLVTQK